MSRRKMEESLAMMNNNGAADSDTVSETEEADNNSEDIPTIVVDPVDDGREVRCVMLICMCTSVQQILLNSLQIKYDCFMTEIILLTLFLSEKRANSFLCND